MTMNTESENRRERHGAFWILVLAVGSTIAVSLLGLALHYHIVRFLK
jgi:hypothetical protein